MKNSITIPHEKEFIDWLVNEGYSKNKRNACSPLSRLRRLFENVLDEFFPKKKKNKSIHKFHEIFCSLDAVDQLLAAKLLDACRELAFDKKENETRTRIPNNSFNDCRTALERYIEFYCKHFQYNGKTKLCPLEEEAVKAFIDKYQKRSFSKKELYDNITFRRRTEGRYTGDVYYPIELIDTIFKNNRQEKKWFEYWLKSIVNKITILIDNTGNTITFSDLKNNEIALEIVRRQVYVYDNCKQKHNVYTNTENSIKKLLKVAIFQSIDIDHTVAISNMLNPDPVQSPHPYPVFEKLTNMINNDSGFKGKNGKKEQVSYLRKTFYKNNNAVLNGMIQKIKDELENFLKNVEFEMMDGHANKKKSNK